MVAFEVMHYMKRKQRGSDCWMALKLDMSKAYDRVEWLFLEAMLLKLGFDSRVVSLFLKCMSSVLYHITHPGMYFGEIIPEREDAYIFCKANTNSASAILHIPHLFEQASRQHINVNKSSIFFSSNAPAGLRESICQQMQFQEVNDHTRYLDLPNFMGRNKMRVFGYMKEKLQNHVQ
ncbi:uncharacterized protein LOC141719579 [Apium graveolens]|uniref:uncharacterized protein LOC141719579 n=1 Tax=Apium graveolens TaxID=4045 RepID=UPI003D7AA4D2